MYLKYILINILKIILLNILLNIINYLLELLNKIKINKKTKNGLYIYIK